ncbi:MAG: ornithine cyclodeaminase family protein, partial [bacterium]|nr:ornithine cyclodeaminase family protein [bacterium]
IKEGMHINAIGADAPGKEELEYDILKKAKVVVDDYVQAIHSGEVNVPISLGCFKKDEIYSSLSEILVGVKAGRENPNEITIFDSTGLAIEDLATGYYIFKRISAS